MKPDETELMALSASVEMLNMQLAELYEKYSGKIRIVPRVGYSLGDYAMVSVEVTQIIAKIGVEE